MNQFPSIIESKPTMVRNISSDHVDQDYQIFISLPSTYDDSEKTYPVLYLVDGNALFGVVKPIVELEQIIEAVPEIIIVGIGYPFETYMETLTARGRDLTINKLTDEQRATTDYPFDETGVASNFLSFVTRELIPMINDEFRTDPDDKGIVGWSMGANFALYTMFHKQVYFNRIVSISPFIEELVELEEQFAQQHTSLSVKLYLSVEKPSDDPTVQSRIEQIQQFIETLEQRQYASLETRLRIFDNTDHFQIVPITLTYALKEIYQ